VINGQHKLTHHSTEYLAYPKIYNSSERARHAICQNTHYYNFCIKTPNCEASIYCASQLQTGSTLHSEAVITLTQAHE